MRAAKAGGARGVGPARAMLVAGAVVVAALVTGLWLKVRPRAAQSLSATDAAEAPLVTWPAGRTLYALSWTAKTASMVGAGDDQRPLSMQSAIDGVVAVERRNDTRVGLSYARVDRYAFDLGGKSAAGKPEEVAGALVGKQAELTLDGHGQVRAIAFASDAGPAEANALRGLALELGYTLAKGAEWQGEEEGSLGRWLMKYQRQANTLLRRPERITRLDALRDGAGLQDIKGGARIELDEGGAPLSIEDAVAVTHTRPGELAPALEASWTFSLRRIGHEDVSAPAVAEVMPKLGAPQPLAAAVVDAGRQQRMDQRLAEGQSESKVLALVDLFEAQGTPERGALVKAGAYLRLHPEAVPLVLQRFKREGAQRRAHEMALDLLVECGSHEAQVALREALASPEAKAARDDYFGLVQRFSFVRRPEGEQVSFLERIYDDARADHWQTAAEGAIVALGATVRNLGDTPLAREANDRLRTELRTADVPMRRAVLSALGNAARADDLADLAAFMHDEDDLTRAGVARALRAIDTAGARAMLLDLAVDAQPLVAKSAFNSLVQQTLSDADWTALSRLAASGKSPRQADSALVSLVRVKGDGRAERRAILTALQERNDSPDNELQQVIGELLDDDG